MQPEGHHSVDEGSVPRVAVGVETAPTCTGAGTAPEEFELNSDLK